MDVSISLGGIEGQCICLMSVISALPDRVVLNEVDSGSISIP